MNKTINKIRKNQFSQNNIEITAFFGIILL